MINKDPQNQIDQQSKPDNSLLGGLKAVWEGVIGLVSPQ